jgi:hypothetical protein
MVKGLGLGQDESADVIAIDGARVGIDKGQGGEEKYDASVLAFRQE